MLGSEIIGLMLIIATAIWYLLKKFLEEEMIDASRPIGNWFRDKIKKNDFYWGKKLKRYKNSLKQDFEKIESPWLEEKNLEMSKIFVPLQINSKDKSIDVLTALPEYKRMIILGEPGSGKSMLCKNILYNYGNSSLPIKQIPVLIRLHELNDNNKTIRQIMISFLTSHNFYKPETFLDLFLKIGKIIMLLDGHDEIVSQMRSVASRKIIDFICQYPNCRFIITSRSAVYDNEFSEIKNLETHTLCKFNKRQISQFLEGWPYQTKKTKVELIQALEERPRISELAGNPLILTIIAFVYNLPDSNFPHSRGKFYAKATTVLLTKKSLEEAILSAREKSLVLEHLAFLMLRDATEEQTNPKVIEVAKLRSEIAHQIESLYLSANVKQILDEITLRHGLLIETSGGEKYEFAHFSIQEYYAAKKLKDNPQGVFDWFFKNQINWLETLRIWCSIVDDPSWMIEKLFGVDPVLAFDCLVDCEVKSFTIIDQGISYFKRLSWSAITPDLQKKSGSLASSNPRFFDFLAQELIKEIDIEKSFKIASCLSFSYKYEAAELIAAKYFLLPQAHSLLVSMNEVAIPSLVKLLHEKHIKAIVGLKEIAEKGSTAALSALLNLIWKEDQISCSAAWLLADLLKYKMVEEYLKDYKLSVPQKTASCIRWTWKPFVSGASNLHVITGRIVFLITKLEYDDIENLNVIVDIRIATAYIIENGLLNSLHQKFSDKMISEIQNSLPKNAKN